MVFGPFVISFLAASEHHFFGKRGQGWWIGREFVLMSNLHDENKCSKQRGNSSSMEMSDYRIDYY